MAESARAASATPTPDLHPSESPHILEGFHLIEADAGTGKTWTLATLVVRAIREGRRQLGEILVVTFTKAATAELSDRIRQFLQQAHDGCIVTGQTSPQLRLERERLRLALAQIDALNVKTIHGFCQAVLRDHSFALDLPGDLVVNEGRNDELAEVLAQWWRDQVLADGLGLAAHTWKTLFAAGLSLKNLQEMLRQTAADPQLQIWPQASELGLRFDGPVSGAALSGGDGAEVNAGQMLARFWQQAVERADQAARQVREQFERHGKDLEAWLLGPAKKLRRPGQKPIGGTYRADRVPGWIKSVAALDTASECFDKKTQGRIRRFTPLELEEFISVAGSPHIAMFQACEQLLKELESLSAVNALLAQALGRGILQRLHERRRARAETGYDGLLQEVYLLVTQHPEVAAVLKSHYPMAMIDESQDTDPLQWAIFDCIYQPGRNSGAGKLSGSDDANLVPANLIMVGDPKQAIYGFRGADVYTYLRAAERVDGLHRLSVNRRSHPLIIAAINRCFDAQRIDKMPFLNDQIQFQPALAHVDPDEASRAATCRMIRLSGSERDALKAEAAWRCVDEIARMRQTAQARQYCVLVRDHAQALLIEQALEQGGIACVRNSRDSIWQTRWAKELLLVLRALAQPGDAQALRRAALVEGLSLECASIDGASRAAPPAFRVPAEEAAIKPDALSTGEHLRDRFLRARQVWVRTGAQAALASLLLAPGLSLKSYAACQQMIELLAADESARTSPLQAMYWLERARQGADGSGASAPWRVPDPDAVQVMTTHNSKGLEFDAVFLPFGWLSGLRTERRPGLAKHHRELADGWCAIIDSAAQDESKRMISEERQAEELRLFYVAMTRAAHHLVLFSPAKAEADSPVAYYNLTALDDLTDNIAENNDASRSASASLAASWQLAPPTRDYPAAWHWQSYTALTRHSRDDTGMVPEAGAATEEVPLADHEQTVSAGILSDDPGHEQRLAMRFRFPRGAKAGVILHKVFERHPFREALSPSALRACFEGAGMPEMLEELPLVNNWLEEVLTTPIALLGGACLRDLPAGQRKSELAFTLPMQGFDWPQALSLVARHYPLSEHSRNLLRPDLFAATPARPQLNRLDGFLAGYIDLIFEWRGRFYILDWKSNYLGSRLSDYKQPAMEDAIAEHDYAMQWCLYQVALLRWLRLRLPGDPLPRLGGVVYAFIRGMKGPAGADSATAATGVYGTRVPDELVLALDRSLGTT